MTTNSNRFLNPGASTVGRSVSTRGASGEKDLFRRRSIIGWFTLLKISLEVVYWHSLAPVYGYFGLDLSPNLSLAVIASFMQLSLILLAPRDKSRPSTYVFIILLAMIFVPTLSYMWLANESLSYAAALWVSATLVALIVRTVVMSENPSRQKVTHSGARAALQLVFVIYIVGSLLLVMARGGIDPRTLTFDQQLYDLRAENEMFGATGYLYNWGTKALFPFFLGYFLTWDRPLPRRAAMASLVISVQLLYYLSFGFKAFLFSILFASLVAAGVLFKRFFGLVIGGMSVAILSSIGSAISPLFELARDVLAFRTYIHPAQIQYLYYDWFSSNEFLYLAETSIGKLVGLQSQYPDGITYRIGTLFSREVRVNVNTGVFSDAFANGGYVGMLIAAIIVAVMLLVIDHVSRGNVTLAVVSLSYFTFTLNDTPLTTALITGGYFPILALLLLARRIQR